MMSTVLAQLSDFSIILLSDYQKPMTVCPATTKNVRIAPLFLRRFAGYV
jgi:hypothetical protein